VLYWYWTDAHGHGDLRSYFLVQYGSLLAVLVILTLFRARYMHAWCLVFALALYGSAKLLESFDPDIYSLGHMVSGHTLKHIAAAGATFFILLMLRRRACVSSHNVPTASATSLSGIGWLARRKPGKINQITADMSDFGPEVLPLGSHVTTPAPDSCVGGKAR